MEINNQIEELKKGLNAAFVDKEVDFNHAYLPQLLSNNPKENKKVLPVVEKELSTCEEFCISVAFITKGGIVPLLQTLKELEKKGVPGKILTTDYLHFSEPEAIKTLANLSNVEIRMYRTDESNEGFHTKGYIFKEKGLYKIIVGSSNLTQSALTTSREWNSRFVSTTNGEYVETLLNEFDEFWNSEYTQKYETFIEDYSSLYTRIKQYRKEEQQVRQEAMRASYEIHKVVPNSMQQSFLDQLKELRDAGESKALLISATGTGKTYASAFAIRDMNPKRVLFLVHREQIAKKSIESYSKIFGDGVTYGLLSGTSKQTDASFLFATRDSMAKESTLYSFKKDEFDVIVVDEVHRAGAKTYQKIMNYFVPQFWLGMTATPERTDDFDIYKLFDHNIACEIRLQQALENDLLCPFHYFGITDITVDGKPISQEDGLENFRYLVSEERINHIIENIEYYGYSGEHPIGLMFVSRKKEGLELSELLNQRGYRTIFLSGEDSQEKREDAIDRLVDKSREDYLDYILSVDVFNEGIDIPEVNQVVMLRPTQSPIVFVQQLGRGLRKTQDKEFVVVLDFIGNYKNNYMIPIALSGDRSYNKDNMRRYVAEGARIIPGSSSIHFDEITRKQIYQSIDKAKTNAKELLVDSYNQLKLRLGKVPTLMDFDEFESIDPLKFVSEFGSYYSFVKNVVNDEDYLLSFNDIEKEIIEYISVKYMNGKKGQELYLLKELLDHENQGVSYETILSKMDIHRNPMLLNKEQECILRGLNTQFLIKQDKKKYQNSILVQMESNRFSLTEQFKQLLKNPMFYNELYSVIQFGISRYKRFYQNHYKETNLCLYQKYTYEEVCRALNWEADQAKVNIGGYKYDLPTKTLPVFINYDKEDDAIPYQDRFVSDTDLIALSKHPRKLDSPDVDHIYKRTAEDKENKVYLFIRKNKNDKEAKEFYFLGEIFAYGEPDPVKVKGDDAFEIHYKLDQPVREDIYDYILSGDDSE